MIEVIPTDQQKKEARFKASRLGSLQGSIQRGAGNTAGMLGEILIRDMFGYCEGSTKDYDLYTNSGIRIDVKTKLCTSEPRDFYECSIISHGLHQNCDRYIFVRVMKNLTKAWLLGQITKEEYFAKAIRLKKGDRDESNNYTVKADCYNLPISELWKIEQDYSPSPSISIATQT